MKTNLAHIEDFATFAEETDLATQKLIAGLIALDDTGQKLDIEVTDTPVDALLQIGAALEDYAMLKGLAADDLKQDIARQMMYFARLVPAEQLYARLFITDTKPTPPDYNPLHMKVYDGTRRHGDDFLQAARTSTIYGSRTSVQSGTDIGALFESGKDKRLVLIVGTRKNDGNQILSAELGGALEALAAAGLNPELYEQITQLLAENPENTELRLLVALMADYYLNKNEANIPALLQQVIAIQAALEKIDIPLPASLSAQIQNIFAEMGGEALISHMALLLGNSETPVTTLDFETLIVELEQLLPLLESEGLLPAAQLMQLGETIEILRKAVAKGVSTETLSLLSEIKNMLAPIQQQIDVPTATLAKLENRLARVETEAPKITMAITLQRAAENNIAPMAALIELVRTQPAALETVIKPLEAQPALRDKIAAALTVGEPAILNLIASSPVLAAILPPAVREVVVSIAVATQEKAEIKNADSAPVKLTVENVVATPTTHNPPAQQNNISITVTAATAAEIQNAQPPAPTGCGKTACDCGPNFNKAAQPPANANYVLKENNDVVIKIQGKDEVFNQQRKEHLAAIQTKELELFKAPPAENPLQNNNALTSAIKNLQAGTVNDNTNSGAKTPFTSACADGTCGHDHSGNKKTAGDAHRLSSAEDAAKIEKAKVKFGKPKPQL